MSQPANETPPGSENPPAPVNPPPAPTPPSEPSSPPPPPPALQARLGENNSLEGLASRIENAIRGIPEITAKAVQEVLPSQPVVPPPTDQVKSKGGPSWLARKWFGIE